MLKDGENVTGIKNTIDGTEENIQLWRKNEGLPILYNLKRKDQTL